MQRSILAMVIERELLFSRRSLSLKIILINSKYINAAARKIIADSIVVDNFSMNESIINLNRHY